MKINSIVCSGAEDYLKSICNDYVDLIITSPPYDDLRDYNGFSWCFKTVAKESYRVLKPGGVLVWVVGDRIKKRSETLEPFKQAIYFKDCVGFLVYDTMIYHRTTPINEPRYKQEFEYMFVLSKGVPKTIRLQKQLSKSQQKRGKAGTREKNGSVKQTKRYFKNKIYRVMSNIWYMPAGYMKTTKDKMAYKHPAMFPEELAKRHILTWSNKGDLVLDYFMGSGTTAKMSKLLARNYIGCDISQDYVDLANERLAICENKYSGK